MFCIQINRNLSLFGVIMSFKKYTYDYKLIKTIGDPVELDKIKFSQAQLFRELIKSESELYVAPSINATVYKLKSEKEVMEFFQKIQYKPKEIQFFSVSKQKMKDSKSKTLEPKIKETQKAEIGDTLSDEPFILFLQQVRNKKK